MGKLADAIQAYKIAPKNSPAEREAAEIMRNITESQWWKDNVGKEFKWPKKYDPRKGLFGFGQETVWFGNMGLPRHDFCKGCGLYKGILTISSGNIPYEKPHHT